MDQQDQQPLSRTVSSESAQSWQQLSSASGATAVGRKSRGSEPETGLAMVERASVSMPPSGSKAIRQIPSRRHSKASDSSFFEFFGHSRNGSAIDDADATPTLESIRGGFAPVNPLLLPESFRLPRSDVDGAESKRLSISSVVSAIVNTRGYSWSGRNSIAGSEDLKMESPHGTTTATSSLSVTTSSQNGSLGPKASPTQLLFPLEQAAHNPSSPNAGPVNPINPINPTASPQLGQPPRRSRSRTAQRRISGSTATSSSPASRDMREKKPTRGIIGVCALESKARSKPARNIFGKLVDEFEVKIFGDKIILDEAVENWPVCDFLISFFSDGFPLDKAIAYTRLRKPFCVNDLPMQQVLWDRRLCLGILDKLNVPTPKRIDVSRDGGPKLPSAEFAKALYERTGLKLEGPEDGTGGGLKPPKKVELIDNNNTIRVDGVTLTKPFVEKPVSGEDHNIHIYFHKNDGGGGRRLFRKINNKSSEKDDTLDVPRAILEPEGSYIYEQFLQVENAEDVKAYTVGPTFCHAETRKSPVVDGLVKRNPSGKEVRYVTKLSEAEAAIAAKISEGFGQRVCGFDLLRTGDQSYVIDVNGWSFVKDNGDYYDKAANILKDMFLKEIARKQHKNAARDAAAEAQNGPDRTSSISQKTASGHRKTLGSLFKSPSMSRMANHAHSHPHLPHVRQASTMPSSPETSLSSTPTAASPTIEKANPIASISPPTGLSTPDQPQSEPDMSVPTTIGDDELHLDAEHSFSDEHVNVPPPASKAQWKLKGVVSVIRHADRTPKQKFKYTFHTKPFVDLLKGHQAEVLLIGEAALQSVSEAVRVAMDEGQEDPKKLRELQLYLTKKGGWPGTKVQIKPMFRKRRKEELQPGEVMPEESPEKQRQLSTVEEDKEAAAATGGEANPEPLKARSDSMSGVTLSRITAQDNNMVLDKLQLIIKWGGEPTHSARHQTQDMGANFRNDLLLMNRDVLDDVHIFSSSERRVTTSAQIFGASFLEKDQYLAEHINVRKDLLDDSNAAKDVMDKVKKRLKTLLRAGDKAPPQFAWPKDVPEPYIVVRQVVDLMKFHQRVMNHNFKKIDSEAISSLTAIASQPTSATTPGHSSHQHTNVNHIQSRWCCNEGPELFKERWEKLFKEFGDADKVDPSKISELYDTMKFDALHNRAFLEWVFTPDATFIDEDAVADTPKQTASDSQSTKSNPAGPTPSEAQLKAEANGQSTEKDRGSITSRIGFRRKSEIAVKSVAPPQYAHESYFKLYSGVSTAATKAQTDARLVKLRDMYHLCKVLFDYIGPQEYGIESEEKLEIGLLTSLPLLKEIVGDLEELQASDMPKCFFYFTKESHIYTLLNCILEGGIKTKIERNAIPELDYLSQINFELYESENSSVDNQPHTFNYSIRITLSPGCHAFSPLDVQLDSRHMIGFSPRRGLTSHQDWKEVLETLRAKFHTVKLPKSFVAIDLSEKVPDAFGRLSDEPGKAKEDPKSEDEERGRPEERKEESTPTETIPIADTDGNVVPPALEQQITPTELPPPALDA